MKWSRGLHVAIAAGLVVGACTSKRDVLVSTPLLNRVVEGRINVVGPCVHNGIQLYDYTIAPTVQYIPGEDFVEIQTIASSGFTGTIYGQVTRLETVSDNRFRATVHAGHTPDGDVAVEAIRTCLQPIEASAA